MYFRKLIFASILVLTSCIEEDLSIIDSPTLVYEAYRSSSGIRPPKLYILNNLDSTSSLFLEDYQGYDWNGSWCYYTKEFDIRKRHITGIDEFVGRIPEYGSSISVAPNGNFAAFRDGNLISLLNTSQRQVISLTSKSDDLYYVLRWSPDSDKLLVRRGYGIPTGQYVYGSDQYIVYSNLNKPIANLPTPIIPEGEIINLRDGQWLSDSKRIVFIKNGEIMLYDTETKKSGILIPTEFYVTHLSLSPDNQHIVYEETLFRNESTPEEINRVNLYSLSGDYTTALTNTRIGDIDWLSNNQLIMIVNGKELLSYRIDSGKLETLTAPLSMNEFIRSVHQVNHSF
ncbi:MAG: hypothetical protein RIF33_00935 [Cyclobacteriaceae bacterium]